MSTKSRTHGTKNTQLARNRRTHGTAQAHMEEPPQQLFFSPTTPSANLLLIDEHTENRRTHGKSSSPAAQAPSPTTRHTLRPAAHAARRTSPDARTHPPHNLSCSRLHSADPILQPAHPQNRPTGIIRKLEASTHTQQNSPATKPKKLPKNTQLARNRRTHGIFDPNAREGLRQPP